MEYFRAFSSELLKLKRTRAFSLSVAAPLAVALFVFVGVLVFNPHRSVRDAWSFYEWGVLGSWLLLVTPLYVALLLAHLASIDHNAGSWKLLLSQPVSRPPLYLAKLAVALLLIGWSNVVLAISTVASGFLLAWIKPGFGNYRRGPDVARLLAALLLAYLATLFIIAIHSWLSARSVSFVLSLGMVILAEMVNVMGLHQMLLERYWPWLYPFEAAQGLSPQVVDTARHFTLPLHLVAVSIVCFAIVTVMAVWDFNQREMG